MLIFKDGSGYQVFPATSDQAHFVIQDDQVKARILAGDPWRLNAQADGVEFESAAEIAARELAQAKAQAEPEIDGKAREVRLSYVSPGKDATYQQKAAELSAWIAAGRPDQGGGLYPYLETEAAARGVSLATVGAEVETARGIWLAVDPQIEAASRAGKVAAQAAATAAEVDQVIANTLASLEGLKP